MNYEVLKIDSICFQAKVDNNKALINYLFISKENGFVSPNAQIHPTALVDPTAIILDDVTVSENCAVGPNTKIHTGARILPNVSLGKNVELHSNAVIGVEGFGYIRDNDNSLLNFPHIGGVLIEDNVVIGANTCVCKGALSNTIIGQGTKIDNLVHIAHNVKIGKDSMIAAGAILCGSCIIDIMFGLGQMQLFVMELLLEIMHQCLLVQWLLRMLIQPKL